MRFFDTHCHLNHPRFDADREEVVARARAAGVVEMLSVGYDLGSSRRAVEMSRPEEGLFATAGIHPHDASAWDTTAERELRRLAARPGVLAVGEIGLDFYRNLSPREVQEGAFAAQCELALELGLPVVVHTRESVGASLDVLEPFAARGLRALMHCWSGTPEEAARARGLGFLLGVGGTLTYPRSEWLVRSVREADASSLVLETDAPYLAPVPHRGKRNEPGFLVEVAHRVAQVRGCRSEDVAASARLAAQRFFGLQTD